LFAHTSGTNIYKLIIYILLYFLVAPFREKSFQFPVKEAVVSDLFYISREYVIEFTAWNSWLPTTKFNVMYMLTVDWATFCIISMYLILCYIPTLYFYLYNFYVQGVQV